MTPTVPAAGHPAESRTHLVLAGLDRLPAPARLPVIVEPVATLVIGHECSDHYAPVSAAPHIDAGRVPCAICGEGCDGNVTVLGLPHCTTCAPRPVAPAPTAGQRSLDARAPVYSAATAPQVSRARVAGMDCTVVVDGDTRTMIPRRMGRAAAVKAARGL